MKTAGSPVRPSRRPSQDSLGGDACYLGRWWYAGLGWVWNLDFHLMSGTDRSEEIPDSLRWGDEIGLSVSCGSHFDNRAL